MKGKVDGTKLTKESEYFREYEKVLERMHDLNEKLDEN